MKKIVFATRNNEKLEEVKAIFGLLDAQQEYQLLSLNDFPQVPEDFDVVEDGNTYEVNAVKKAREYGDMVGEIVIADDSGLEVDALSGRPGIYSARYGGPVDWVQKKLKLLEEMKYIPEDDRGARFVCVLALYSPISKKIETCCGVCRGRITTHMRGEGGFGFDAIFYDEIFKKTLAQMTSQEKNTISHRYVALKEAYDILKISFF